LIPGGHGAGGVSDAEVFQSTREEQKKEFKTSAPRTQNPSAFMAAIDAGRDQKLREQEKELERLHRIEKGAREQTERLSEEVTRNCRRATGSEATGIISTSNPAAEQVLGIRGSDSALQRGVGSIGRDDQAGCGSAFERENFPARKWWGISHLQGHAAPGSDDLADPAR